MPQPANMVEQHLPAIPGQLSCNIWRKVLAYVATYSQHLFGVDSAVLFFFLSLILPRGGGCYDVGQDGMAQGNRDTQKDEAIELLRKMME